MLAGSTGSRYALKARPAHAPEHKKGARSELANCQIHYQGEHPPEGRRISLGDRAPDGNITSCLTKRLGGRERLSTLHFPLLQRSQPYALVSRAQ